MAKFSYAAEFNKINFKKYILVKAAVLTFIGMFIIVSCSDSGTSVDDKSHDSAIIFDIDDPYIAIEDVVQPVVTVLDGKGNPLSGLNITWSSSQSNVAEVNSSGRITGKVPGKTIIEATAEGVKGSTLVEVFLGSGQVALELQEIDRAVVTYMEANGIPGGSLTVVMDGRLLLSRGYGYADPETQREANPATIFRYGIVSKPIWCAIQQLFFHE